MRAVVQRVSAASVTVDGAVVGEVGRGFLLLLCAMAGDGPTDESWMLDKVLALRVFPDDAGKMNRALHELESPGLLVVSQFTLSAELAPGRSKGNRPAFTGAMPPEPAKACVDRFVAAARAKAPYLKVATGVFGADMKVALTNDGPVTLWLDSRPTAGAGDV